MEPYKDVCLIFSHYTLEFSGVSSLRVCRILLNNPCSGLGLYVCLLNFYRLKYQSVDLRYFRWLLGEQVLMWTPLLPCRMIPSYLLTTSAHHCILLNITKASSWVETLLCWDGSHYVILGGLEPPKIYLLCLMEKCAASRPASTWLFIELIRWSFSGFPHCSTVFFYFCLNIINVLVWKFCMIQLYSLQFSFSVSADTNIYLALCLVLDS